MRCLPYVSLFCLLGSGVSLPGQMTPNAPVQDFRFPRFGENGYTQWVLQGEEGVYDSDEQIRVAGMALRVYSGDERMARELSLDSPRATLRLQENRAFSEESIEIVGTNFTITGVGWEWSGETKEIEVHSNTVVRFTQGIARAFSGDAAEADKQTEIRSERLLLRTTEDAYYFEFTDDVQANAPAMHLQSERLIAIADPPEGRESVAASTTAPTELEALRRLTAEVGVTIVQSGKTVRADTAEFFPREERAILEGNASVTTPGAYLSGASLHSQSGEIVLAGAPGQGRAQMILTETGGLGLQGSSALSAETIVLANSITMRELVGENRFLFEGAVEVMSGALQMRSGTMRIETSPSPTESAGDGALRVGNVLRIVAKGDVEIEQQGQLASGDQVVFHPDAERAVLTGDPQVKNAEAVVTGQRMELEPRRATIHGDAAVPVSVRLPQLPDLGYDLTASETTVGRPTTSTPESVETVVTSRLLRMIEVDEQTRFQFTDTVRVEGTNLDATSDRLDVIARKSSNPRSGGDSGLELEAIEATGNVVIEQAGRVSTAAKALILPEAQKVVLEGDVAVNDDRGRVSGHRMTLLQGQRRAIVEGGGSGDGRARISLPALPD